MNWINKNKLQAIFSSYKVYPAPENHVLLSAHAGKHGVGKRNSRSEHPPKPPRAKSRGGAGFIFLLLLTLLILGIGFLYLRFFGLPFSKKPTEDGAPIQTETTYTRIQRLGVLKVGSDLSLLPWGDIDPETGTPIGGEVELTQLLGKKLGVKVEFVNRSWDFIIEDLLNKRSDVIIAGMSITEERQKRINFSAPYLTIGQALTVREDSGINSVSDLQGKTIGVQAATTSEAYAKKIPGIKEVRTYEGENVEMLYPEVSAGKVDAVIYDSVASNWFVRNNPGANLVVLPELLTTEDYGAALRKEDSALKEAIDKAIFEIKTDPEYQRIVNRWYAVSPQE